MKKVRIELWNQSVDTAVRVFENVNPETIDGEDEKLMFESASGAKIAAIGFGVLIIEGTI